MGLDVVTNPKKEGGSILYENFRIFVSKNEENWLLPNNFGESHSMIIKFMDLVVKRDGQAWW